MTVRLEGGCSIQLSYGCVYLRWDLNPHDHSGQRILSPLCLPIPPHRLIFYTYIISVCFDYVKQKTTFFIAPDRCNKEIKGLRRTCIYIQRGYIIYVSDVAYIFIHGVFMNFRKLLVRIAGKEATHRIRFSNGYSISIQCSEYAYSSPRVSGLPLGQYTHFEVAVFDSENNYIKPEALRKAADIEEPMYEDVFSYIPESNVQKMFDIVVGAEEGSLINEPTESEPTEVAY
jgi:hypothetical protein